MKNRLMIVIIVLAVSAAVIYGRYNTEDARRARLAKSFLGVVPDSVGDDPRREIRQLLDRFWEFADDGKVGADDVERINAKITEYVEAGRIQGKELVYFMADVGYTTFKNQPEYNLPDGIVDHPILNPDAAVFRIVPDTAKFRELGIPIPDRFKPGWQPEFDSLWSETQD